MITSPSPSPASETLEDYLAGDYHQDMDDIRELEETLERTANVFIYARAKDGTWAYELSRDNAAAAQEDRKVSHGTQGMIAAALAKMLGDSRLPSGTLARLRIKSKQDLKAALKIGLERLEDDVIRTGTLISGSFGRNDPITTSHISELRGGAVEDKVSARASKILNLASADLAALVRLDPNSDARLLPDLPAYTAKIRGVPAAQQPKQPKYLRNAFVPLRIARIVAEAEESNVKIFSKYDRTKSTARGQVRKDPFRSATVAQSTFKAWYRRFFESTLHEQLSYSDIPDSRFDPAELIFCLEGLLIVSPRSVDERLMARVIDVLEARQDESAHWRPNRPLYATPQGMTMLPISVEGAVSLMRSISLFDRDKDFQDASRKAVGMLRRFWQWLLARSVEFELEPAEQSTAKAGAMIAGQKLLGWHSEHVNDPGLIHLWDTSQVIEFMLGYRQLLQRAVAGRTLELSGLKVNRSAGRRPDRPLRQWVKVVEKYEPQLSTDKKKQVYRKIFTTFIAPWAQDRPGKASSMLLYGPPGTGKSTVGENIADALGMRMITVTVSDFLGRGGAHVEARAKAIFQTLEAQFDTVILFDEIDAFLLDRDSNRYEKQDTLFQFLTPGMLTKINDLHKLGRSIFIIATNYKDRIDPAIQRKGRIDQHYLLGLPDKERREAILKEEIGLGDNGTVPSKLVDDSVFYGYSDIKAAVADAGGKGASEQAVADRLAEPERAPATVASYLKRVKVEDDKLDWSDFPPIEFDGLWKLWHETHQTKGIDDLLAAYKNGAPKHDKLLEELKEQLKLNSDD
ncbi:MAG: ATP-binding protein [Allosphingosinicella sp.]|uniref:ATP-binding protein n=1 Tax=Allosphingosinicella sp. TaxID=2823234 RepID=UPI0039499DB7